MSVKKHGRLLQPQRQTTGRNVVPKMQASVLRNDGRLSGLVALSGQCAMQSSLDCSNRDCDTDEVLAREVPHLEVGICTTSGMTDS